jgi:hypothetical protein
MNDDKAAYIAGVSNVAVLVALIIFAVVMAILDKYK